MLVHGGDIYRNKVDIDFSVNTSPYGVPPMVRAAVNAAVLSIAAYPDPLYEEIREAIGKAEGVPKENIICGNGSSELLFVTANAIAKRMDKKQASLLVPCFSEYEKALRAAGFVHIHKELLREDNDFLPSEEAGDRLVEEAGLIILGNPNNPTGKLLPKAWLERLLFLAEQQGTYVILDETFLPFSQQEQVYEDLKSRWLIRIRAFTKTMSIPGVRLGYLICDNEELLEDINSLLPDWNVSIIAAETGVACAQAKKWFAQKVGDAKLGVKALREDLQNMLSQYGCKVYSSDANFLLLQGPEDLYEKLLGQGILIRNCSNYDGLAKGFYRIAVRSQEENAYLACVLKNILQDMTETEQEKENRREIFETKLLNVQPAEIEKTSFSILSKELEAKGIVLSGDTEPVIKRCIHTTADFQYASTLTFSKDAVAVMKKLLREGACIVTDTNMALSGINKTELSKYGGEAFCFMAEPEIARIARERGCTRATVSMEHAASLGKKIIFAVGNAPTALVTLCEMADRGVFIPDFVIGVPVGFVNVEQAKEMVLSRDLNYIVNRGRKGGSNVAAAIVNAVLYAMRDE